MFSLFFKRLMIVILILFLTIIPMGCTNTKTSQPSNARTGAPTSEPSQQMVVQQDDGSRFPIQTENGWGYINRYGVVVIPPQFSDAYRFYEGLARVSQNGLYGYIDLSGKFVIPLEFARALSFSDGLAAVALPEGLIESGYDSGNYRYGYINHEGEFEIPPSDAYIGSIYETDGFTTEPLEYIEYFHEGFRIIDYGLNMTGVPFGFNYIGHTGAELFPGKIDYLAHVENFSEGLASVFFYDANKALFRGQGAFINASGQVVFIHNFPWAGSFSEGLAKVSNDYNQTGFIDKSGNLVIPLNYSDALDFTEGFAGVKQKDGNLWGFIDTLGNLVIDYKYACVKPFSNGLAMVTFSNDDSSGSRFGYVNTSGEVVLRDQDMIPGTYYEGTVLDFGATSFIDGLASVHFLNIKNEQICGISGYINTDGEFIYTEKNGCEE